MKPVKTLKAPTASAPLWLSIHKACGSLSDLIFSAYWGNLPAQQSELQYAEENIYHKEIINIWSSMVSLQHTVAKLWNCDSPF